jgi:predicted permease
MTGTPRDDRDFDDEIRAHIDLEADRLIEDGLPAAEAQQAARHTFGNVTVASERFYESRRVLWLDHLRQDLRSAVRSLARYRIASAVAVISLAGGIGATTATLIVRDAVFVKPPRLYVRPAELSRVQIGSPQNPVRPAGNYVPAAVFNAWREESVGATLAAVGRSRVGDVRAGERQQPAPVRPVTRNVFDVLGVAPAAGRPFSAVTAAAADAPPALLSYRLWQILFDGSPDVIGKTVLISNEPHVVIGVMPAGFWFSAMDAPVWTRLEPGATSPDTELEVVGRRDERTSPAHLAERLQPALDAYARQLPVGDRQVKVHVSGLEGTPMGRSVSLMLAWLLGVAVALTLLIACANVAILVIAQWTSREEEIAIRASLGASRSRIVRTLLTESVVIAIAGGLLGIAATFALRGYITRFDGDREAFLDFSIDPMILVTAALLAIGCGVLAGIGPALLETRRLQHNPLRAMRSSDRVKQRWRHGLVVLETSVTVALLVVASTMVDAYRRQLAFQHGFETGLLATVRVQHDRNVVATDVVDILERIPGVTSVVPATAIPYGAFGSRQRVAIDAAGSGSVVAEMGAIGPGFFATLGVPMRAGRTFGPEDSDAAGAAIVTETLARRLFDTRDPLGQHVWVQDRSYEIVGVSADYFNSAFQAPEQAAKLFVPIGVTGPRRDLTLLVRTAGPPAAMLDTFRREIQASGGGYTVSRASTFDQVIAISGQEILVGTAPLIPLIATGLLLTAAGIYGVLAFAVARRSRELALRIAIGATRADLVRFVAAHSMRLILVGLTLGIGTTFVLSRIARAAGGGAGSVMDPKWIAFAAPIGIVFLIGLLATWIPSRRVLRIDPATILRTQ